MILADPEGIKEKEDAVNDARICGGSKRCRVSTATSVVTKLAV